MVINITRNLEQNYDLTKKIVPKLAQRYFFINIALLARVYYSNLTDQTCYASAKNNQTGY